MQHYPSGSKATRRAPDKWFTGVVYQNPIIEAPEPARVRAMSVHFTPGARTHWHAHPLGQTLHVVSGSGLAQSWGEEPVTLNPGDTLWIPPGEKHWHGAGPDTDMTHIAIQEALDGKTAEWMEPVTDEQYPAVM